MILEVNKLVCNEIVIFYNYIKSNLKFRFEFFLVYYVIVLVVIFLL